MWKQYLPNSEIWFGEYDEKCVSEYAASIRELGIKVVTGDQSDNATLARWVQETGGGFDVIIVSCRGCYVCHLVASGMYHVVVDVRRNAYLVTNITPACQSRRLVSLMSTSTPTAALHVQQWRRQTM